MEPELAPGEWIALLVVALGLLIFLILLIKGHTSPPFFLSETPADAEKDPPPEPPRPAA